MNDFQRAYFKEEALRYIEVVKITTDNNKEAKAYLKGYEEAMTDAMKILKKTILFEKWTKEER